MGHTYLTGSNGFSGWGWLSFAAGMVALALTTRLIVAWGRWLDRRMLAWLTVAAGVAELLGNALFIGMAPKTEIFIGVGQVATRGVGLTIATVAGVVLIASGLLMLASRNQRTPAVGEQGTGPTLVAR
jgi:hypothetical protein